MRNLVLILLLMLGVSIVQAETGTWAIEPDPNFQVQGPFLPGQWPAPGSSNPVVLPGNYCSHGMGPTYTVIDAKLAAQFPCQTFYTTHGTKGMLGCDADAMMHFKYNGPEARVGAINALICNGACPTSNNLIPGVPNASAIQSLAYFKNQPVAGYTYQVAVTNRGPCVTVNLIEEVPFCDGNFMYRQKQFAANPTGAFQLAQPGNPNMTTIANPCSMFQGCRRVKVPHQNGTTHWFPGGTGSYTNTRRGNTASVTMPVNTRSSTASTGCGPARPSGGSGRGGSATSAFRYPGFAGGVSPVECMDICSSMNGSGSSWTGYNIAKGGHTVHVPQTWWVPFYGSFQTGGNKPYYVENGEKVYCVMGPEGKYIPE